MQPTRQHLPADQRRAVTVEAVVDLAAEQNPGHITTAAIAKHMNVTQGALFRHFANKAEIWQAVMEWVAERLLARVDKAARAAPTSLAALEAVFMTHTEFIGAHPGVPRMMFGELQRAEDTAAKVVVRTLIRKYTQRVAALIEGGKLAGEVDPAVDTEAAGTLFVGTIQGLVMQSLLAGDITTMGARAMGVFAIYRRGIEHRS